MDKKNKKTCLERSRRVVVAMSGGVDSSVVAALLEKQGYDVVGIFMKFWNPSTGSGQESENRCCSTESEKRARQVAKKLNIPFFVVNAKKEFKKKVVDYFLKEYKKGNTPNPCVVCNKEIKFGFLIEKALKLGADFVATGHYARLRREIRNPKSEIRNCEFKLLKGKDKSKDQSYFLWQLNQKQLSRVLFPVGNYTKTQVRALAKKFKLPVAETPESQEICFVQNTINPVRGQRSLVGTQKKQTSNGVNEFLKKYLKEKPGKIIEFQDVRRPAGRRTSPKILGEHRGLWFYTIGQRKGIGLSGGPYFVIDKDFKNNNLIVSKNKKDLLKKELFASSINWIFPQKLPLEVEVKIRYRSELAKAKITKLPQGKIKIIFQKPQKAVTPGQSVVFYRDEELLGGGVIS